MKNKLRLVVNWVTFLTLPVWYLPSLAYELMAYPEGFARETFIRGERLWWE